MRKISYFLLTRSIGIYLNLLSLFSPNRSKILSYALFSKPREGKLQANALPEVLKSARQEAFEYDSDTVQTYLWRGGEPVILLVHGWESNASRWERLLPFLQKTGATIVAVDAPNHGLSTGAFSLPRYGEIIHEVAKKYNPSVLIGHSLGGAASIFYQHKYRNPNLEKLVLLGAPADFSIIVNNYGNLLNLKQRSRKLFANHFKELFNYHPDEFTAREFAKSLDVKGLIAHDTDDTIVLFEEAGKISKAWEQAKFIETTGLGHSLHDEKLYETIADFICN